MAIPSPPVPSLRATYTSPTTTHTFSSALPSTSAPSSESSSSSTVQAKTAYVSALRAKVSGLQEDINAFLTAKMEEDKAGDAAKSKRDEEREEQMYGEEDVGED
ncbi:hypothetical protein MBLNU459_g8071t1 [Dothideomycetes sp. NU459]